MRIWRTWSIDKGVGTLHNYQEKQQLLFSLSLLPGLYLKARFSRAAPHYYNETPVTNV
jgi:hypothetical protein